MTGVIVTFFALFLVAVVVVGATVFFWRRITREVWGKKKDENDG